jgi:AmiR/NasT family two-component response regulator
MRAPSLPDIPVVIGDADEYSRRLVREMLRAARIRRIHEVTNAEALTAKLRGLGPGIAFIDLELPALSSQAVSVGLATYLPRSIGLARRVTYELACTAGHMFAGGVLAKPLTPSALWRRTIHIMDGMPELELSSGQVGNVQANPARLLGGLDAR